MAADQTRYLMRTAAKVSNKLSKTELKEAINKLTEIKEKFNK